MKNTKTKTGILLPLGRGIAQLGTCKEENLLYYVFFVPFKFWHLPIQKYLSFENILIY